MLTDNQTLVGILTPTPTIFCAQRKAPKKLVNEDDLIASNIAGFGDDIGKVTNYVTSMYDVRAKYTPGTLEYDTLSYRIMCGQQFQQNAINGGFGR